MTDTREQIAKKLFDKFTFLSFNNYSKVLAIADYIIKREAIAEARLKSFMIGLEVENIEQALTETPERLQHLGMNMAMLFKNKLSEAKERGRMEAYKCMMFVVNHNKQKVNPALGDSFMAVDVKVLEELYTAAQQTGDKSETKL